MKKYLIAFIALGVSFYIHAQEEQKHSHITINGYVETYYVYDFNKPENNTRPAFIYSYNRHNEVNLNIGFVRASYNTNKLRSNLALMTGTYSNANLASEPGVLKNIYEAYTGVKISSTKNLWIDAGIFASHIGFESAVGKDSWTLTRSIMADNTPYYEAGAKISYTTVNEKWFLSALFLNGWQRIQRVQGNSLPSFGTQLTFKPTNSVTLNSSTFFGTVKPDSARLLRYFHNFYGIFQLSDKVGLTIGFDSGLEENNDYGLNTWLSPIFIARFGLGKKTSFSLRGEYYADEKGVTILTGTPNGFKTTSLSANMDYQILPNALWRIEARLLTSKDDIFVSGNKRIKNNTFVSTALCISF